MLCFLATLLLCVLQFAITITSKLLIDQVKNIYSEPEIILNFDGKTFSTKLNLIGKFQI